MTLPRLLVHLCLAFFGQAVAAPPASPVEGQCQVVDSVRPASWKELHAYFRKYGGGCADGAQAEGLAEVAAELLAERWSTLPELQSLSRRDPAFLRWVLSRPIMSPENHATAELALANLNNKCTKQHHKLCKSLAKNVVTSY